MSNAYNYTIASLLYFWRFGTDSNVDEQVEKLKTIAQHYLQLLQKPNNKNKNYFKKQHLRWL